MAQPPPLFDQTTLLAAARELRGERFGDAGELLEASFSDTLAVLLEALHREARLSPEGAQRVQRRLIDELAKRSDLARFEGEHPAVAQTPVERPLIITGFPRTGTSLLHNLLARVPGLWAPPMWQLRAPLTPPAEARALTQRTLDTLYTAAPELRAIRPMDVDWPDECNLLMSSSFTTLVNAFRYFVPSYVRHLRGLDMRPAYADHRRWLRALLTQRAAGQGQDQGTPPRLVLKDPFHLWQLEALLATYPDATVIHLHRDPAEVAPSLASLCATRQSVHIDAPRNRAEIGAYTLAILDNGLRALERSRANLPAERFIDLPYRELVASPGQVVRRLGASLDFPTDTAALADADRWLQDNRQHKAGRHRYTAEDFGMSEDILDEYFADYRVRFAAHLA